MCHLLDKKNIKQHHINNLITIKKYVYIFLYIYTYIVCLNVLAYSVQNKSTNIVFCILVKCPLVSHEFGK